MTFAQEISAQYTDGNGLVTPNKGKWAPGEAGSDNGPMFTAEYLILAKVLGGDPFRLQMEFIDSIAKCMSNDGMLHRKPPGQPAYQEQVDDYYATLAASVALGNVHLARAFLRAVWTYKGALNTENPGTWTANSFLIRQPQLLYAMIVAAYPKNPLAYLLSLPLRLWTALVIAASCRNAPTSDTDARRLAWHLILVTPRGPLVNWAIKAWFKRLFAAYPNGMQDVARMYYEPGHPIAKYWPSSL